MTDFDQLLVSGIKSAMAEGKVSMRGLSTRTKLPYRSLQNYLSGTSKMPASAYVAICQALGIDNQYVLQGSFELPHAQLWDALWDVFGDALVDLKQSPNTSGQQTMELHNRKQLAASEYAAKISIAYNGVRLAAIRNRAETPPPTISEKRSRWSKSREQGPQ